MTAKLSRRIGEILGAHLVRVKERRIIIDAAEKADTWEDLPTAIRELLDEIEQRPGPGVT